MPIPILLYSLMTFRSIFNNKMNNVFNERKKVPNWKLKDSMEWRKNWGFGITTMHLYFIIYREFIGLNWKEYQLKAFLPISIKVFHSLRKPITTNYCKLLRFCYEIYSVSVKVYSSSCKSKLIYSVKLWFDPLEWTRFRDFYCE